MLGTNKSVTTDGSVVVIYTVMGKCIISPTLSIASIILGSTVVLLVLSGGAGSNIGGVKLQLTP